MWGKNLSARKKRKCKDPKAELPRLDTGAPGEDRNSRFLWILVEQW